MFAILEQKSPGKWDFYGTYFATLESSSTIAVSIPRGTRMRRPILASVYELSNSKWHGSEGISGASSAVDG